MERQKLVPLMIVFMLVVGTAPAIWSQPQIKLVQPDLVRQGETFTGMVVQETATGDVPLEGGQVVFRGQVIPIEQGGRITLPAFVKEAGNIFVAAQVIPASGGAPVSTAAHHFEVVPLAANVPTRIAEAPTIATPGAILRISGQNLSGLQKAALVNPDGSQIDLGKPVGSSLQLVGQAPGKLPQGTYRFVAWDAAGNRYEAPNQTRNPSLQLDGQRITRRGQRGTITVLSDTDGTVLLSGGEPIIVLDQRTIAVHANLPEHVKFTAPQVGNYTVNARIANPEDVPAPREALRVDARQEPVQTRYDSSRNQTRASVAMSVVDEAGGPVANVHIRIAVSHPNGIEYSRAVTNQQGHASIAQTFPGRLSAADLSAHIYQVLGHPWKQDADCKCSDLKVMLPDAKGWVEWHELKDGKGGADEPKYSATLMVVWEITCSGEKGGCEGNIKLSVENKDGISLKEWAKKDAPEPKQTKEITYKCTGKCPGRGLPHIEFLDLLSKGKATTQVKLKVQVDCGGKKGEKTIELWVYDPATEAFRAESPADKAKREAEEDRRKKFGEYIDELRKHEHDEHWHEPDEFWEMGPTLVPIN